VEVHNTEDKLIKGMLGEIKFKRIKSPNHPFNTLTNYQGLENCKTLIDLVER
jgi:hypothetical protein